MMSQRGAHSLLTLHHSNCMREVHHAHHIKKPFIFIHEADIGHGGMPLDGLLAACPADLHHITTNRPMVVWHRIPAFLERTLALVAESILLASPAYHNLSCAPLVSPTETMARKWVLPGTTPVVIHATRLNLGAVELLEGDLLNEFLSFRIGYAPLLRRSRSSISYTQKLALRARSNLADRSTCRPRKAAQCGESCSPSRSSAELLARADAGASEPTHLLVYLNQSTFSTQSYIGSGVSEHRQENGAAAERNSRLEAELFRFVKTGLPIILVHERRATHGGCEFDRYSITHPLLFNLAHTQKAKTTRASNCAVSPASRAISCACVRACADGVRPVRGAQVSCILLTGAQQRPLH